MAETIRDVPFPDDLAPIAADISMTYKLPLTVVHAMIWHMRQLMLDQIAESMLLIQTKPIGLTQTEIDNQRSEYKDESSAGHYIVWLYLAQPLGIPDEKMQEIITAVTKQTAEAMKVRTNIVLEMRRRGRKDK